MALLSTACQHGDKSRFSARGTRLLTGFCLLLALGAQAFGDEPPAWAPFETVSANGRFRARVAPASGEEKSHKDRLFQLTVFEGKRELWSCRYEYDGYRGGLLADDGRSFVYVSFWYRHDGPAVTIYRDGSLHRSIPGREFAFDRSQMTRSASHNLWLDPERGARLLGTDTLLLHLADGRAVKIGLD